jgi:hypothetical protein
MIKFSCLPPLFRPEARCTGNTAQRGTVPTARAEVPSPRPFANRLPNLTTLARRHGGIFPEEYVTNVLRFGPGFSAHGSSEMPVWGPLFQYLENYNEAAVRQRIKNLCNYLESLQEK